MSTPYRRINRNSLGQFKRRYEVLVFKSREAGMIVNPAIALAEATKTPFFGPSVIPWSTPKGEGRTYSRKFSTPKAKNKRYVSL